MLNEMTPTNCLGDVVPSLSSSSLSANSSSKSCRAGAKRKRSEQERRERHNDTERKGRQKINSEILLLKDLLPELQNAAAPKANVLQCAVDNLKRLQALCQTLLTTNLQLKDENKKLWVEVNRLRSIINPHDSLLCEILEQKLGQQDNGFTFPGPLAPPPIASMPMSMGGPMSPQQDMCGMRSSEMITSNGNVMSFPSLGNTTKQMWYFSS